MWGILRCSTFRTAPHPAMKQFVLAPALAALAMFFWGFVYYGISGIPYRALGPSGGPAVAAAVSALETGTYIVPDMREGREAVEAAMKTGPVATVHVRQGPPRPMGKVMALGFAHEFIACLLLALLLAQCRTSFTGFADRWRFALLVGVLIAFFSKGSEAIWWQQPLPWNFSLMFYDIVAWALAGAVLAKFFASAARTQRN